MLCASETAEPLRSDEAGTRAECALGRLEAGALRLALSRKVRGAPGPDGVTAEMLRHTPAAGWAIIADMLRGVEDGADWPVGCSWVRIAVLAKPGTEGAPEPGKVRLIAVKSLPIRCWATARAVGLMPWLEYVIGKGVIGGVRGRHSMRTAAARDCVRTFCFARQVAWGEVSFDFSRCFDTLPRGLLLSLAVAKGFPRWLAQAVERWLAGSKRFLAYRGITGEAMATTIGVPQGNALVGHPCHHLGQRVVPPGGLDCQSG